MKRQGGGPDRLLVPGTRSAAAARIGEEIDIEMPTSLLRLDGDGPAGLILPALDDFCRLVDMNAERARMVDEQAIETAAIDQHTFFAFILANDGRPIPSDLDAARRVSSGQCALSAQAQQQG